MIEEYEEEVEDFETPVTISEGEFNYENFWFCLKKKKTENENEGSIEQAIIYLIIISVDLVSI